MNFLVPDTRFRTQFFPIPDTHTDTLTEWYGTLDTAIWYLDILQPIPISIPIPEKSYQKIDTDTHYLLNYLDPQMQKNSLFLSIVLHSKLVRNPFENTFETRFIQILYGSCFCQAVKNICSNTSWKLFICRLHVDVNETISITKLDLKSVNHIVTSF